MTTTTALHDNVSAPTDNARSRSDARPEAEACDLVARLAAAAREAAAVTQGCDSWSVESRDAVLASLDATARSLAAARTPVLVAQERSGSWVAPGIRSFDDARSRVTRSGRGAARAQVQDAHTLADLDGGAEALADGDRTEDLVRHLRPRADKLPPERRSELLTRDAPELLDLARQHDAPTFARKVEDLIAAKSPQDNQDDHDRLRAQRFLTVRDSAQGLHLSGLLDPVAGYSLRLALEAATPTPAADDSRSPAQRRADALSTLASHALDDGAFKPGAPQRPHVMLTIDAETYAHALAHLRAGSHTPQPGLAPSLGGGPGESAGSTTTCSSAPPGSSASPGSLASPGSSASPGRGTPSNALGPSIGSAPESGDARERLLSSSPSAVRLDDGPLVPPSELGRLLCSSELTRLVIGADSLPLDVGRAQRLYTGHLRRAVVTRDMGCRWEGCSMPARHCEVHHIDWWDEDHGRTTVETGVLLCDFHHHEVHRRDLDVRRKPRGGSPPVPPGHADYQPPEYEMASRSLSRREREAATQQRLRQSLVDRGKIRPRPLQSDPGVGTPLRT